MNSKTIEKRLDTLTSVVVRNREKKCFTCGKRLIYNKRQAGHFIPRVVKRTRWDLRNVHVQCAHCNVELGGNVQTYSTCILLEYGEAVLSDLCAAKVEYDYGEARPLSEEDKVDLYNRMYDDVKAIEAECGRTLVPKSWKKIV